VRLSIEGRLDGMKNKFQKLEKFKRWWWWWWRRYRRRKGRKCEVEKRKK